MIYNLDAMRGDLILDIGNQGENNARTVRFDISAWLAEWPDGAVSIAFKRPEDLVVHPVPLSDYTIADGILTWTISIALTAYGGYGHAVVTYTQGGVIRKSPRINTLVKPGLPPAGPAPDTVADWIAEANTALNAIETLEFTINDNGELLAGETVLGRVSDNPRGDYNPDADPLYSRRDIVFDNGGSFVYINDTPSNEPTSSTSHWQQIASVGGKGDKGDKGDTGDVTAAQMMTAISSATTPLNDVAVIPTNIINFDFSDFLRVDAQTAPVYLADEESLSVDVNGVNTSFRVPFDTVAGHDYHIKIKITNITLLRTNAIYGYNSTASANKIADLVSAGGDYYECDFTAVETTSYYFVDLAYTNTGTVTFSEPVITDLNVSTSASLKPSAMPDGGLPLSKLQSIKLSDFDNDENFESAKIRPRRNLLNPAELQVGYSVYDDNGVIYAAAGCEITGYIPTTFGDEVFCCQQNSAGAWIDGILRYAFYDVDKVYVSGGQNLNSGNPSGNNTQTRLTAPVDGFIVISMSAVLGEGKKAYVTTDALSQSDWGVYAYEPYRTTDIKITHLDLYGTTLLTYGDSITVIGNGDSNCRGWQKHVCDYFGIPTHYGRGIGASTITWRNDSDVWYSNPDGSYNSRGATPPVGTAGVDYIVHDPADGKPSSFCSWDRIKTMIPDAIKDDIDLILIMGGTNDRIASKPIGSGIPQWSASNITDGVWVNDADYNGGDFDILTYRGALASTIMKMQLRCPSATVVVCTPLSGYGITENITADSNGKTLIDFVNATIEVAQMMSAPCIDVYGTCGINQLNFTGKITDGTHPYSLEGCKLLGGAVTGGLSAVNRIIES